MLIDIAFSVVAVQHVSPLIACVALGALVALEALIPHVAPDVLGTLGVPLVALCIGIPESP